MSQGTWKRTSEHINLQPHALERSGRSCGCVIYTTGVQLCLFHEGYDEALDWVAETFGHIEEVHLALDGFRVTP